MKLKKCLQHWGTKKFEDKFFEELSANEDHLPLQGMCRNDGYPSTEDCAQFENLKLEEEFDRTVTGSFHVSFTEEQPTSCRDLQFTESISGEIEFELNLDSGEIEFESTELPKREYDADEF